MAGCKLLCVLLICAAAWLTMHLMMTARDEAAGVVQPMPEKDGPHNRFHMPAPEEPLRDPKF